MGAREPPAARVLPRGRRAAVVQRRGEGTAPGPAVALRADPAARGGARGAALRARRPGCRADRGRPCAAAARRARPGRGRGGPRGGARRARRARGHGQLRHVLDRRLLPAGRSRRGVHRPLPRRAPAHRRPQLLRPSPTTCARAGSRQASWCCRWTPRDSSCSPPCATSCSTSARSRTACGAGEHARSSRGGR